MQDVGNELQMLVTTKDGIPEILKPLKKD